MTDQNGGLVDWEAELEELRQVVQNYQLQLNRFRGVRLDQADASDELLVPLYKQLNEEAKREREAQRRDRWNPPTEAVTDAVSDERARRRQRMAYCLRRVKEEQRLYHEAPEPYEGSDLQKAWTDLTQAAEHLAAIDGTRRGTASTQRDPSWRISRPAPPPPQPLHERVWGAIRKIWT